MRKWFFLCLFLAQSATAWSKVPADTLHINHEDSMGMVIPDTVASRIVEINRLLSFAEQHLGTPYRYGGKKPGGFDCSGFVMYCFSRTQNMLLSPSATTYFKHGIKVHPNSARPGDIICFTGSNSRNRSIGHVGIVTEVTPTDIYFIHAAVHGGIRYDALSTNYYKTRFLQIQRVIF